MNHERRADESVKAHYLRMARRGTATRSEDYNATFRATGDHRAAIRVYCAGNKWMLENAKAVWNI